MAKKIKTINIKHTHAQAMSVYLLVLDSGNAQGKKEAREALMELAKALDQREKEDAKNEVKTPKKKKNVIRRDTLQGFGIHVTNELIKMGIVKDCTDTDDEDEFIMQDMVAEATRDAIILALFEIKANNDIKVEELFD